MSNHALGTNEKITTEERAVFEKPTHALIEVTDVGDGPSEFDALSTIITRHLRPLSDAIYRMSEPGVLNYAADFASQLPTMAQDRIQRAIDTARKNNREIPADVQEIQTIWREKTLRWLNNYNPRNQRKTDHQNGRMFHLALANGVEIAAVPPSSLQILRARKSLDSLFRVPVENHPLVPIGEQFTSSVFGKTAHEAPEHLELVWRRGMDESHLDSVIPRLIQPKVAFIDQPYHNRRIITPNLARTVENIEQAKQNDGSVIIQIGNTRLRAYQALSLSDVPEGEWGIWHNPADGQEEGAGYIEVSRRWDVDKDWTYRGQFPSYYLQQNDRHIGAPFEVLPKDSKINTRSAIQEKIGSWRKKSA